MGHLLDDPALAGCYLFPRRQPLPDPYVVHADGAELHCWRSPRRADAPLLVHFHGNGEVVADYVPDLAPLLIEAGFDVVLAEYRAYGGSTGTPTLRALADDALAVVDAVIAETGVKPYIYGRSVGALPAVHAAAHREIAGLILESGVAALDERLLLYAGHLFDQDAVSAAAREGFDHAAKLARYDGPTLILHAAHDQLVTLRHAERHAKWTGGRLVTFRRGDHNSILAWNLPAILQELKAFAGLGEVKAG